MVRKRKNIEQYEENLENNDNLNQQNLNNDQIDSEDQNYALDDLLAEFDKTKPKTKKKRQFYVKKQDLLDEISKYQESKENDPNKQGYISEKLGQMVLKICTRFSLHPKFFGYSYREQMVADAVMRCLSKGLDKIDTKNPNSNPFSYLTQIAFNCFRARINNEKKFMTAKQKFREQYYGEFEQIEGLKQTLDNMDQSNE